MYKLDLNALAVPTHFALLYAKTSFPPNFEDADSRPLR
jgi:hypothetical protein